jgi:hypothetical protein
MDSDPVAFRHGRGNHFSGRNDVVSFGTGNEGRKRSDEDQCGKEIASVHDLKNFVCEKM